MLTTLKKKAMSTPWHKASNELIRSWHELEPTIVKERVLYATILYACKVWQQWKASIPEGEFVSLVWLAHDRAVDSWDWVHPYAGWFGLILTTECSHYIRSQNPVWVPMHYKSNSEQVQHSKCIRPDTAEEGDTFWETLIDTGESSIATEIKKHYPETYSHFFEGYTFREIGDTLGVSGEAVRKLVDKQIVKIKNELL